MHNGVRRGGLNIKYRIINIEVKKELSFRRKLASASDEVLNEN